MTELVIVSAVDDRALVSELNRIIGYVDRVPDATLVDIAYTCSQTHGESVIAIIADSTEALRARLVSARNRLEPGTAKRLRDKSGTYYFRDHLLGPGRGKLAFVYPGVMSFYPDMMRDLAIESHACRNAFDELEEAMAGNAEFTPSSFIFPPADYYRHDADIFSSGAYAEALVATYGACVAYTRLLQGYGLGPDGVVGFAGGDLAAMMRSGAAGSEPSRPDRVRIIREIYQIIKKAVDHAGLPEVAMVTVLLRHAGEIDELVRAFPPNKFMLAVDFSPRQKTYAVTKDFEAEALAAFAAAGIRAVKLALNRPFNTKLCEDFVPYVKKFVSGWMNEEPDRDIYSCATAEPLPRRVRKARSDTAERWAKPVRFEETVRRMYDDGYRVFLEVGPRGLMTSAVADTLRGVEHAAIAVNSIHRSGLLQLQHAVAQLVALGAKMDVSSAYVRRKPRRLDFDSSLAPAVRRDSEMLLSRLLPRLSLSTDDRLLPEPSVFAEPKGRGAKAAARAAAVAQQARRLQRQFDFGAMNPLVSDADTMKQSPGVSIEIAKTFRLADLPFIGDSALGTSQLSYSDPNLKGLVPLTLSVGAEIMAEVALLVMPNRQLVAIDDLVCRRMVAFRKGALKLFVLAERVASGVPRCAAVKVQLRDETPNGEYTWPVMEATFMLREKLRGGRPLAVEPLVRPRTVHWSGRDIYPLRLCCGKRLRGIQFVETWSESGLDYEVAMPPSAGNVKSTQFPLWVVNPLLMEMVVSGFQLWRSHEKFAGAFGFPFRLRRLDFNGVLPKEGSALKCYLRLTGVTPKSQICDISVSDGNGKELVSVSGWEELTERVPTGYRELILQPATTFLTDAISAEVLGNPSTDVSSAYVVEPPYGVFERNEELWLKTLSHVILGAAERQQFLEMTGSTSRRTEWLFGRVAAKEAVRRFLRDHYQARWSDADIQIWADDSGKPHALGAWADYLAVKLDIAIAHTSQFIVALAAANARIGVDVESVGRDLSEEFTTGVFTPDELEIAAQAASPSRAIIRFWCAKEAVSKALGTGIRYSPREMTVVEYLADSGKISVELTGAWLEAFKVFTGRRIDVVSRVMRDHALAFCFIPASLFEDGLVVNTRMQTPTKAEEGSVK